MGINEELTAELARHEKRIEDLSGRRSAALAEAERAKAEAGALFNEIVAIQGVVDSTKTLLEARGALSANTDEQLVLAAAPDEEPAGEKPKDEPPIWRSPHEAGRVTRKWILELLPRQYNECKTVVELVEILRDADARLVEGSVKTVRDRVRGALTVLSRRNEVGRRYIKSTEGHKGLALAFWRTESEEIAAG